MISLLALVLLLISGISKAVMDKVNFHFSESIFKRLNPMFWDPYVSSLNKYKHQQAVLGPKFFLSTTVLVWTTDAWHLFQMIHSISKVIAFVILTVEFSISILMLVAVCVIGYAIYTATFELFFKFVFSK